MTTDDDTIDDADVYRPRDVPEDVWQAARRQWACDPSDEIGYRQPEARVGQQRLAITCRVIMAERKRAVAAIHWVFSADGTKTERSMADEAINKINDPSFVAA